MPAACQSVSRYLHNSEIMASVCSSRKVKKSDLPAGVLFNLEERRTAGLVSDAEGDRRGITTPLKTRSGDRRNGRSVRYPLRR